MERQHTNREKLVTPPSGDGQAPMETDGFQALPKSQIMPTFIGVILAMLLGALDQTVVGTAMPRVISELGGFDRYTWVTTAYLVTSTTVVPIVGKLTDMYGRKWFYVGGLVIFLLGSALSGLSQDITQLIFFRAFQGIGGGMMIANAFVVIGDLFPPAERGKYQGFIGGIFGLASVIGPTLGGFLTDNLTWRSVFYINIPLGILVIAIFIRFFPHIRPARRKHEIDYLGIITLILSIVPLMLALSWGGVQYAWSSPQVVGALVPAIVMGVLFIFAETRAAEPILPLSLFRNSVVSISLFIIFLTGFGMFGGIIFIPLFFQGVLGISATSSGSFLMPMMLGLIGGSALSGQALSRFGGHYRLQGVFGMVGTALGMFLLSRMTADTSYSGAVLNIVVLGFGLGVTMPLFTLAVQNAVPYSEMGVATSSTQFLRSIGGTLGLSILGSVMSNRFATQLASLMPQAIKSALSQDQFDRLVHNPQALFNPQGQTQLSAVFSQLGPQGGDLLGQLLHALKQALAFAINETFLIGTVVVTIACVATFFLKEIPLKRQWSSRPGRQRRLQNGE